MGTFLAGHRTYLVALAGALLTGAYMLDLLRQDTWLALMGFLGATGTATGTATLRAGVAQVEAKVATVERAVAVQGAATVAQVQHVDARVGQVAAALQVPAPPLPFRRGGDAPPR